MDYATLVADVNTAGSIANWASFGQVQAVAPDIVNEAESFIYRTLRHWKMLHEASGNYVIGNDYIPIPDDYLQVKTLWITGIYQNLMRFRTEEYVKARYCYNGNGTRIQQMPTWYYQNQANFMFDSPSDQTYPYQLVYYQQLLPLSISQTNFLTQTYPRLVRCACMFSAAEYLKDLGQSGGDQSLWEEKASAALEQAQQESDQSTRATQAAADLDEGYVYGGYGP